MKIAVFDTILNDGGGKRFILNLLPAIKNIDNNIEIDLYCQLDKIINSSFYAYLHSHNVNIYNLNSLSYRAKTQFLPLYKRGFNFTLRKLHLEKIQLKIKNEIIPQLKNEIFDITKNYDIAFFPWPFLIDNIDTFCPKVATFHDFNFKYFFGAEIFTEQMLRQLESQTPEWIKTSIPIVSTFFMESEIRKFYPIIKKVKVIQLAPLSGFTVISKEKALNITHNLGIDYDYIIYPTNLAIHKNISVLFNVIYKLNKKGYNIKLLLTGAGTENFKYAKATEFGIERNNIDNYDVVGLGYVTDEEIDSLIQCAKIVISSSKYEAGCGPALDAWIRGVPVAMSNIPAFVEHLEFFGVKAQLFDAFDANDIVSKLEYMLNNYDKCIIDANVSQDGIKKYTWENTAQKYYETFLDILN